MGPKNHLPNLTSLAIKGWKAKSFIGELLKTGLPHLTSLFIDTVSDDPELGYVDADNEWEDEVDDGVHIASAARQGNLPKLCHLTVVGITEIEPMVRQLERTPLMSLALLNCNVAHQYFEVKAGSTTQLELQELNLSDCSGITQNLSPLLHYFFGSLNKLILSNDGLGLKELKILVQANVEGRLTDLRYLDISNNKINEQLALLFSHNCTWNQLFGLNISDAFHVTQERQLPSRCLESLKELSFSDETIRASCFSNRCWSHLEDIHIDMCYHGTLSILADAVEQEFLPALQTICLRMDKGSGIKFELLNTDRFSNISIHETKIGSAL